MQQLKSTEGVAAALFGICPSPENGGYHYRAEGVSNEAVPFLRQAAVEFHARGAVDSLDRPVTIGGSDYRLVSLTLGRQPRYSPYILAIVSAAQHELPTVMAALRERAAACFGEYCDLKWK